MPRSNTPPVEFWPPASRPSRLPMLPAGPLTLRVISLIHAVKLIENEVDDIAQLHAKVSSATDQAVIDASCEVGERLADAVLGLLDMFASIVKHEVPPAEGFGKAVDHAA